MIDEAAKRNVDLKGIGIGTPGIVDNGVVLGGADNLDRWYDVDLGKIYSNMFNLPIFVDNDANVMGLGEVFFGAAKDSSGVIFLR